MALEVDIGPSGIRVVVPQDCLQLGRECPVILDEDREGCLDRRLHGLRLGSVPLDDVGLRWVAAQAAEDQSGQGSCRVRGDGPDMGAKVRGSVDEEAGDRVSDG